MSDRIPDDVLQAQRLASDPSVSAWVAANAGSGKTHVLAQRVIRLLLEGNDPGKILCLTYTKAAAANMANRVFETLGQWTALDDAELDRRIAAIEGRKPDATRRIRARRLFAEALETPGGLKVQTIHAFCTRLLHQFPFEADVAARFEVLEDRARSELIDRLRLGVLLEAAAAPASPLGRALATAISIAADQTFADVVGEAITKHGIIMPWITAAGGLHAAIDDLSRLLGIDPADTDESLVAELFASPHLPPSYWPAAAEALAEGSKTDNEHAARLQAALTLRDTDKIAAYLGIFCTKELLPRKSIVTKGTVTRYPELAEQLLAEQRRVCAIIARRRAVATRERTAALITVAEAVIRRYQQEKDRRGLLDYDDLIGKTLRLLDKVDAAWVHYKLDLGINHVLIDEAQDTSPQQWEIVRKLTAEFFAGAGARGSVNRSVFAVGDEKQSIYSFQGAAPDKFAEMQRHFAIASRDGGRAFEEVRLRYSFRSAPLVLEAVDEVFKSPQAHRGLSADEVRTVHEAVRRSAPGLIEVWPPEVPDEKTEIEAWDAPFDASSETSPRVRLAKRIAAAVRSLIDRGERVGDGDKRRPVRAGDILVLVRQRGALFEAVIRALKESHVPVAGADRLVLTEHIAVMDLMVLADALLMPADDLALATVLKSPLFGLDEDQLFRLAFERKGSLRRALRAKADEEPAFRDAADRLDRYAAAARSDPPFAFYARLLGAERGRLYMLERLGPEAADALDEFLEFALDYERRETPSLQGFVAWLRSGATEIKRDMDIARDEVRVMTVHGAKGLEAPVVFVADTTAPPKGPRDPRLLALRRAGAPPGAPDCLVWAGRKDDDVQPVADARAAAVQAAENEYRRLLYVAMTRAADRLVVCGAVGQRGKPAGCWYDLMHDALKPEATEETDTAGNPLWRWRKPQAVDGPSAAASSAVPPAPKALPAWLSRDVVATPAARPVSPSRATPFGVFRASATDERRGRLRGEIIHRLLQALPDIPPGRRAEAAERHLARNGGEFDQTGREAMAQEALGLIRDPQFASLFAPGSRAEVPIVGWVTSAAGRHPVSGQVDRLVVSDREVLIADYKTNRPAPRRPEDVPKPYVTQLALYRAVLAKLYPGRLVRAALLFTDVPVLMEVSASDLDRALESVTTS